MTNRFVFALTAGAGLAAACSSTEPEAPPPAPVEVAPIEAAPVKTEIAPTPAPTDVEAPEPDIAAALVPIDPAPAPEPEAEPIYTYQWMGKDGSLHLTQTPPPPGAKLMRRIEEAPAQEVASAPVRAAPPPRRASSKTPPQQAVGVASWRSRASIGKLAPALEGRLATGHAKSLESLRGEPVLVAFVTRTCPYCLKQGRATADLMGWGTTVRPLTVIRGDEKAAQAFAKKTGQSESTIMAVPASAFPRGGVPHTVLVDREGVIVSMARGFPGRTHLDELLNAKL